jgi:dodecin
MSVAKVTEIISNSSVSMDDAIQQGIDRACRTLKNVTGAWVQDQSLVVTDGKISGYRVALKVTFVLTD